MASPLIHLFNKQSDLKLDSEKITSIILEILSFKGVQTDELAFSFIDSPTMESLHEEFFDDPSPTDCITFPIDSPGRQAHGPHILGEAFICPKTAMEYIKENGGKIGEEMTLYIIHCILHFLGYDDQEPGDVEEMRAQEKICLDHLKKAGLVLENSNKTV